MTKFPTLVFRAVCICLFVLVANLGFSQVVLSPNQYYYLNQSTLPFNTITWTGAPTVPGANFYNYEIFVASGNVTSPTFSNVNESVGMSRMYNAGFVDVLTTTGTTYNTVLNLISDTISVTGLVRYTIDNSGTIYSESFTSRILLVKITATQFNFGTINGAGRTICTSASVGSISQTVAPVSSTTPTYQWYYKDGINTSTPSGFPANTTGWTAISGANNATYNPGTSVTVNRTFARTTTVTHPVHGISATGWSTNVYQVTINTPPTFTAGSIKARRDSFCYNSNAPLIAELTAGSVQTGSTNRLQYQWFVFNGLVQNAPTGTTVPSGWTAVAGATDSIFDPPACNYASRTYARRVRTNHTCSGWQWSTNTAQTIIKTNCVTWGAIDRTSQTVCHMGDPYSFQVTFNSTNFRADSATWQWYYKDGLQSDPEPDDAIGSWQWITYYPQRTNSYDPPAGAYTSRTYACRVTLINPVGYAPGRYTKWARCAAQVVKLNPVDYGTLSGNLFSCWGAAPSGIALSTNPSGGTGQFSYQWYYTDGFYGPVQGNTSGWTAIPGATSQALTNAPVLQTNATFACLVTPTGMPDCGQAKWANGQVYVNLTGTPTDFGSLGWTTQNVNANGDPTAFSFSRFPTGAATQMSFQWYYKAGYASAPGYTDPIGSWIAINGANNAVYDPPRYPNQTMTYAVRVSLGITPNCGTRWAEGSRTVILNNAWSGGGMSSSGGFYGIDGAIGRVRLSPNPFTSNINLLVEAKEATKLDLVVTDVSGKTVFTQPMNVNEGTSEIQLDQLSNLSAGVYILYLQNETGRYSQRIVKQ